MDFATDKLIDSLSDWWLGLTLEEKREAWELWGKRDALFIQDYQARAMDLMRESLRRNGVPV